MKLDIWFKMVVVSILVLLATVRARYETTLNFFFLNLSRHGETPSVEQTQTFINICDGFIRQRPLDIIG